MRYFWPIARIVFCPLTILFIYFTVTEPQGNKQDQSIRMQQETILQKETLPQKLLRLRVQLFFGIEIT